MPPVPAWPLGRLLLGKKRRSRLTELLGRSVGDRIVADFVVLAVALVTWGALFAYLVRLDKSLRKIEKK